MMHEQSRDWNALLDVKITVPDGSPQWYPPQIVNSANCKENWSLDLVIAIVDLLSTSLVNRHVSGSGYCVPTMILEGSFELRAPKEKLWSFLIDPNKMAKCFPDLQSLEVESADRFVAVVRVGVGPIKADFKFRTEILGKEPIDRVRLKAVGSGSGNSIILDVGIELKDIPGGSELLYKADVKVGGIMASLGQRVIRDTADKTITAVFECVKKQVE